MEIKTRLKYFIPVYLFFAIYYIVAVTTSPFIFKVFNFQLILMSFVMSSAFYQISENNVTWVEAGVKAGVYAILGIFALMLIYFIFIAIGLEKDVANLVFFGG